MLNGSGITLKILLLAACFSCIQLTAQVRDTSRFNSDYPSFKIDEECKSKSERTAKPTLIKYSKEKLALIKTVKQLIPDIPAHCEILCVFMSVKKSDDKVFEFRNMGNEIVYADRLVEGKFIIIENLVTSCSTLHKANFKIIIE